MELFCIFAVLLIKTIDRPVFQLLLLEAARDFLKALPMQARNKIYYNIKKVRGVVRDNELFKKLENSEIWEFRTLYQRDSLWAFFLLG